MHGTGPRDPGAAPGGGYATGAGVSVPQVGGDSVFSGGFTIGGCQVDEPAILGLIFREST